MLVSSSNYVTKYDHFLEFISPQNLDTSCVVPFLISPISVKPSAIYQIPLDLLPDKTHLRTDPRLYVLIKPPEYL